MASEETLLTTATVMSSSIIENPSSAVDLCFLLVRLVVRPVVRINALITPPVRGLRPSVNLPVAHAATIMPATIVRERCGFSCSQIVCAGRLLPKVTNDGSDLLKPVR